MKLLVCKDKDELGEKSARFTEKLINEAISEKGYARILLSTGASQFPFFDRINTLKVI